MSAVPPCVRVRRTRVDTGLGSFAVALLTEARFSATTRLHDPQAAAGGPIAAAALLFRRMRRAGPGSGDQPLRAAEGQVLKSPLDEHEDAALKIHQVHQVDE